MPPVQTPTYGVSGRRLLVSVVWDSTFQGVISPTQTYYPKMSWLRERVSSGLCGRRSSNNSKRLSRRLLQVVKPDGTA